jgi:hypothetical protein
MREDPRAVISLIYKVIGGLESAIEVSDNPALNADLNVAASKLVATEFKPRQLSAAAEIRAAFIKLKTAIKIRAAAEFKVLTESEISSELRVTKEELITADAKLKGAEAEHKVAEERAHKLAAEKKVAPKEKVAAWLKASVSAGGNLASPLHAREQLTGLFGLSMRVPRPLSTERRLHFGISVDNSDYLDLSYWLTQGLSDSKGRLGLRALYLEKTVSRHADLLPTYTSCFNFAIADGVMHAQNSTEAQHAYQIQKGQIQEVVVEEDDAAAGVDASVSDYVKDMLKTTDTKKSEEWYTNKFRAELFGKLVAELQLNKQQLLDNPSILGAHYAAMEVDKLEELIDGKPIDQFIQEHVNLFIDTSVTHFSSLIEGELIRSLSEVVNDYLTNAEFRRSVDLSVQEIVDSEAGKRFESMAEKDEAYLRERSYRYLFCEQAMLQRLMPGSIAYLGKQSAMLKGGMKLRADKARAKAKTRTTSQEDLRALLPELEYLTEWVQPEWDIPKPLVEECGGEVIKFKDDAFISFVNTLIWRLREIDSIGKVYGQAPEQQDKEWYDKPEGDPEYGLAQQAITSVLQQMGELHGASRELRKSLNALVKVYRAGQAKRHELDVDVARDGSNSLLYDFLASPHQKEFERLSGFVSKYTLICTAFDKFSLRYKQLCTGLDELNLTHLERRTIRSDPSKAKEGQGRAITPLSSTKLRGMPDKEFFKIFQMGLKELTRRARMSATERAALSPSPTGERFLSPTDERLLSPTSERLLSPTGEHLSYSNGAQAIIMAWMAVDFVGLGLQGGQHCMQCSGTGSGNGKPTVPKCLFEHGLMGVGHSSRRVPPVGKGPTKSSEVVRDRATSAPPIASHPVTPSHP